MFLSHHTIKRLKTERHQARGSILPQCLLFFFLGLASIVFFMLLCYNISVVYFDCPLQTLQLSFFVEKRTQFLKQPTEQTAFSSEQTLFSSSHLFSRRLSFFLYSLFPYPSPNPHRRSRVYFCVNYSHPPKPNRCPSCLGIGG